MRQEGLASQGGVTVGRLHLHSPQALGLLNMRFRRFWGCRASGILGCGLQSRRGLAADSQGKAMHVPGKIGHEWLQAINATKLYGAF